jgi:formate dehydrogenase subunit delta
MSSTIETLRRMANDIARNLQTMGHDEAILATADHINQFWDPRMKEMIFADDRGNLIEVAAAAIDHLAAGGKPGPQTLATVFATAHETGHSDAG